MKLYEVNAGDGEPSLAYATKREALVEARRAAREYSPEGEVVSVDEITLDTITKALVVRLVNNAGGYVVERRTVFSIPSQRKAVEQS